MYHPCTPTQHQYMLVEHKPSDKVIMKDSSKVIYSEVDKDKLKPPPVSNLIGTEGVKLVYTFTACVYNDYYIYMGELVHFRDSA